MAKRYKGFKKKKEPKPPSITYRPMLGRSSLERLRELLSEESFDLVLRYSEMTPAKLFATCMSNTCLQMGDRFRGSFPHDALSRGEYRCMSELVQRGVEPALALELDRLFYMVHRKKLFAQMGFLFRELHERR